MIRKLMMALVLMPMMALATTWYVNGSAGSDSYSGKSASSAKATIQAAIDASSAGDTILVAPGTYAPILTENKKLTIIGTAGYDTTVIDGGGSSRCATLSTKMVWGDYEHYPNETNTILQGFTLQNGRLDENGEDNSSSGGGAYGGTIIECRIRNNRASGGGGARFAYLYHCIVEGNYVGDDGGGILNCQAYDTLIANNYANNREGSKAGGGAGCSVLYNCTVTGNTSCYGYWWTDLDIYPCAAVDFVSEAYNCIIYGNKFQNGEVIYRGRTADIDEGTARGSQFYNCYTYNPGFVDAANGDYRLAAGSPCIDAGDNSYVTTSTDLAGNARIANGRVDIGCYEYGAQPVGGSLSDGLVAYWPFDGNANDASGNGNHGVVHGATLTRDRFGNANSAYHFDGAQWIQVANNAQLRAVKENVTLSAWIKPTDWFENVLGLWLPVLSMGGDDCRQYCFEFQWQPEGSSYWVKRDQDGYYYDFGDDDLDAISSEPILLNEWQHVALTVNGAVMKCYRNGVLVGEVEGNPSSEETYEDLYIGNDLAGGDEFFYGALDDIRIYNRALSAAEVKALYDGTAVVSPTTYKVTFNANGGSVSPASRSVASGAAVGTLPIPTRMGYSFAGWWTAKSGGAMITSKTKVTKDVTYYARWTANKYKIKFNANGGTGTMKTISATYGKSMKLTANAFKRSKYTFVGWATKKSGAVAYKDRASVKNLTATDGKTVTLYAVWKPYSYTVKFNANGGTGVAQSQTVKCGAKTKLAANTYVREGFVFAGWATKKNGPVVYKNKANVKDIAKKDKTVTLYAVWKPAKWAVGTFKGSGEVGGKAATATLTVSSAGKVSGKFVVTKGKETYSFKAIGLDGFSDGALRATTTLKIGSKTCALEIAVGQASVGCGVVTFAEMEATAGGKTYAAAFLQ